MVRFQEKSLAFVLLFLSVYYLPAFAQHHDKSEQAALCDFITSTNIGVVASSWNCSQTAEKCSWSGITCNQAGNVTSMVLNSNVAPGLSGTLPNSLCNLRSLQHILIYTTGALGGTIPSSLGELSSLTYMNFNARLTGPIPDAMGNLSDLAELRLFSNSRTSTLPSSLAQLQNLRYLYLPYNRLTGTIPDFFQNMSALYYIHLQSNRFMWHC